MLVKKDAYKNFFNMSYLGENCNVYHVNEKGCLAVIYKCCQYPWFFFSKCQVHLRFIFQNMNHLMD